MSDLFDHATGHAGDRGGADAAGRTVAGDASPIDGLRSGAPWRSVPLSVSNDRAEAYFEIYRIVRAPIPALREVIEWRWRFCTPDGQVRAASEVYASAEACRDAVDALRRAAGGARVQHAGSS